MYLTVSWDNLQTEKEVFETDKSVFPSTNLRSRVSMSRLCCCSRSLAIVSIETPVTMKIHRMDLRKPLLWYTYRLRYVALGFPFSAFKLKTASCSRSSEFIRRTLTYAPASKRWRTFVITSAKYNRRLCSPATFAIDACRLKSFSKYFSCWLVQSLENCRVFRIFEKIFRTEYDTNTSRVYLYFVIWRQIVYVTYYIDEFWIMCDRDEY